MNVYVEHAIEEAEIIETTDPSFPLTGPDPSKDETCIDLRGVDEELGAADSVVRELELGAVDGVVGELELGAAVDEEFGAAEGVHGEPN
ncbi:hypothetical protein CJ030_MR5G003546 [Morella rubra]|uniref:Uncharacterized protein n=1 Tax=Morella rubra TaxID=262757 RepID=A0A6A1VKW7_9ROSI|nr:hypothetical protein CJ030_MR5G003546 [Morella rubra]